MKRFLIILTAVGLAAAAVAGGPVKIGEKNPLVPPFCEDMDYTSQSPWDDFERFFQVIDANQDGRSWQFYNYSDGERLSKCAYLLANTDRPESDDWLIPRAVRLQGGKHYCVHLDAKLFYGHHPSRFEVKYGLFNDPEGLDVTVIPDTEVSGMTDTRYEGWICPEFDALYYIGVHSIWSEFMENLMVDNISVDAPVEGTAPSEVRDVVLRNDPLGGNSVAISFKAPLNDMNGNPLQQITSISVRRDGEIVATFQNVIPGQEIALEDMSDKYGDVVYNITPSNASGEGRPVYVAHFKGIGRPEAPVITSFVELPGNKALITWQAPSCDEHGSAIDPGVILYKIYAVENNDVTLIGETGGDETSMTISYDHAEDEQMLVKALVSANLSGHESDPAITEYLCVGKPYDLPYHNSFTYDDYLKYIMEISSDGSDAKWVMLDDHSNPSAQDGDNGYVCLTGTAPDQWAELISGKIDLSGAGDVVLECYVYVYSGDENELHVNVYDMSDDSMYEAGCITMTNFAHVGWNRVYLPLPDTGGRIVRIGLKGVIVTNGYLPLDNMTVRSIPAVDLAAGPVSAPAIAGVGDRFAVDVTVINEGCEVATGAEAILIRDGVEVDRAPVDPVNPGEASAVILHDTFSSITSEMPQMQVRIDVAGDSYPANNLSELFVVAFEVPTHPAVTDLSGEFTAESVTLKWNEPDITVTAPRQITETFEQYAPFSIQLDGWTMIDRDGGIIVGFPQWPVPEIDGKSFAYFVADTGEVPFLSAASGTRSLATLYTRRITESGNKTALANDDWLITPTLYGGRQTVRFRALSVSDEYGYETFETYWSDGSLDPEDFTLLTPETQASVNWREYYSTLPDGARYFAVRCTSNDVYAFQLDDISYIPEGEGVPVELIGYNVYRNNERLNVDPVTATTFIADLITDDDRFFVTVIYDLGESVASNIVSYCTAIDGVGEDEGDGIPEYFNIQGIRVGGDDLTPGVYIRRKGSRVTKIIVK